MIHRILCFKLKLRNMICYMMYIVCIVNSLVFIYKLLIDIQNVKSMWEIGLPLELALYSGIIGIMCEYRPRDTQQQIKHDDLVLNQGLACIILLTLANAILIVVGDVVKAQ